jgi:hypothetical protein
VCNYDGGSQVDVSESDENVSCAINSKNKIKAELVGDARTKRPRLEPHSVWPREKADNFYYPSKIQFSVNSGPIKSVRST